MSAAEFCWINQTLEVAMHHCTDTQAVCRGCGLKLRGSPSWKGGLAYQQ